LKSGKFQNICQKQSNRNALWGVYIAYSMGSLLGLYRESVYLFIGVGLSVLLVLTDRAISGASGC